MNPGMLINWMAVHGVELVRSREGVRATSHDRWGQPIESVDILWPREEAEEESADIDRALKACDALAVRLCVVKPSTAFKLNQE